jgi:hypothetical protein
MAILLRVDVDKPYGHHNLVRRIASKLVEDYELKIFPFLSYLPHLKELLWMLNENQVSGFFFFRLCTFPDKETKQLLERGHHSAGLHAENTRTAESFLEEVKQFNLCGISCSCFTKHGSGTLKLGKHHYPPYEVSRYRDWARKYNIKFFSGNGTPHTEDDLILQEDGFWPNLFWMEHDYRSKSFNTLQQFKAAAIKHDVVLLIHPENFYSYPILSIELQEIIDWARVNHVSWRGGLS